MHHFAVIISILLFIVIVSVVAALKNLPQEKKQKHDSRYQQQEALFTAAEKKFLVALDSATQGRYRVFGKVRVADVLEPEVRRSNAAWYSAFGKIKSKHFDFVLCNPTDLKIAAVVELDDSSHAQRKRRERDNFLDAACQSAELPLIHFPAKANYDAAAIRTQLAEVLGPGELGQPDKVIKPCPNCGHGLERIEAQEGALAGKPIWRCSRYPACRTLIPALP